MRTEALNSSQAGGVLLTQTEAKMIFGALMPIARTHHNILKELRNIYNNWSEESNPGEVYQKYVSLSELGLDCGRGSVWFCVNALCWW